MPCVCVGVRGLEGPAREEVRLIGEKRRTCLSLVEGASPCFVGARRWANLDLTFLTGANSEASTTKCAAQHRRVEEVPQRTRQGVYSDHTETRAPLPPPTFEPTPSLAVGGRKQKSSGRLSHWCPFHARPKSAKIALAVRGAGG